MNTKNIIPIIITFFILSQAVFIADAANDLEITSSNSFAGIPSQVVAIDDLVLTGTADSDIPVKLLVTSGSLSMTTTTGLTFTGPSSGATIYFEGSFEDVNNALATLQYTRASMGGDILEISLVEPGQVFFASNNHLYEYISDEGNWNDAVTKATALTRYGAQGYLTTITSAEENGFVADRLLSAGWMGASDVTTEGDWKWVTGPENGTSFWLGEGNGNTVNGNYANWNSGEPNNSENSEDCGQFLAGASGNWNDLNCSSSILPGYVAEFGTPGNDPTVVAKNITITITNEVELTSTNPSDDETSVDIAADIVLGFNKDMVIGTGNIVIKNESDDSVFEIIDVTSGNVSGSNSDTITIDTTNDFEEGTNYYVVIDDGAFEDIYGLNYAGITDLIDFNFQTQTYPDIEAITPDNNFINVEISPTIIITFSESMDTGVVPNIMITPCNLGVGNNECAVVDGVWSNNDKTFTTVINNGKLDYKTTYTITIDSVSDLDESLDLLDPFVSVFTTVQAPTSKSGSRRVSQTEVNKIFGIQNSGNTTPQEIESPITVDCSINYSRLIKRGMRGEDVRDVQRCMNSLGYTSGPEDGIYGVLTYSGITSYQRDKNLVYIDGIVGPETSASLNLLP